MFIVYFLRVREETPRIQCVCFDLRLQRCKRWELGFVAKARCDFHTQLVAIEISLEIKQVPCAVVGPFDARTA